MRQIFISLFIALLLTAVATVVPTAAQYSQRNTWRTYSALNDVQDLAFDGDSIIWGATTGGVMAYHIATDSFEVFRNTEGLLSLNSTAIAIDPETGDLYVGAADGSLSIRHRNGSWSYSSVIATATSYPERRINGFGFHGGRAFVLTSFGGIVYDAADSTVVENFVNLGTIPRNTAVNDILFWKDAIWLATDRGITRTSIDNNNLNAPNGWLHYPLTDTMQVLSLAVHEGNLIFGTRRYGAWMLQTETGTLQQQIPGGRIYLAANADSIVATSEFSLYRFRTGEGFVQVASSPHLKRAVAISAGNRIVVGTERNGLGLQKIDSFTTVLPNAPVSNSFNDVTVSSDRSVWTAHDGAGVSRLVDGTWQIFTGQTTGIPGITSSARVNSGADSTIWASTNGAAVNVFNPVDTGFRIIHYDKTNSPITPVGSLADFQIVGDVMEDLYGNTWIVNTDPEQKSAPLFIVKLPAGASGGESGEFVSFVAPADVTKRRAFVAMTIDDNGTKWAGGAYNSAEGLLYFNDGGTLTDKSDDAEGWGLLRTSDGLPSSQQTALVVDPDGILWIGTPSGLATLVNPVSVVNNNQRPDIRPVRPLKDVPITAIAVDALNRKWVGTSQGVYVLNFEGTEVLERYTKENSPLVHNAITSIVADDATGDVYIGTINGLSRVSTPAVEPGKGTSRLRVCPQPFILPSAEPLRIEGLPASAVVKVLNLSGSLVREVQSPGGGVAFWDGNDQYASPVPTGIYLIAAGSDVGDETVVGKVAVIRR